MYLFVAIVISCYLIQAVSGEATRASGVAYIGKGYNIIDGNPDGVKLSGTPPATATDPGIIPQQLLTLTYINGRMDPEGRYTIPDQLNYSPENNCFNMTSNKVIFGEKSYQKKLLSSVDASAGFDGGLIKFAFSAGMGVKQESESDLKSQKVYFDETIICTYGSAIYRFGNDPVYQQLSSDIKREICKLNEFRDTHYYELFDNYGTHFIHGAVLGLRHIRRKETTMISLFEKVIDQKTASTEASGSYMGQGGSLDMKLDTSSLSKNADNIFTGDELIWTVGSKEDNKPTKIFLSSIEFLIDPYGDFWFDPCQKAETEGTDHEMIQCCKKLSGIHENVKEALSDYATHYRKVSPPQDPNLDFELVWPEGTYILPRTSSGCANGTGFTWASGLVHQDTPDWRSDNKWTTDIHWDADQLDSSSITQKFCVKGIDQANKYELRWPRGSYCIIKYRICPAGFKEGWIKWDDESTFNRNTMFGSLPSGEFDTGKTKIDYCCRDDGSALQYIYLPSSRPFYLLRAGTECQKVGDMQVTAEFVQWSRETWGGLSDAEMQGGEMPPYNRLDNAIRLYYCYYEHIETIKT